MTHSSAGIKRVAMGSDISKSEEREGPRISLWLRGNGEPELLSAGPSSRDFRMSAVDLWDGGWSYGHAKKDCAAQ